MPKRPDTFRDPYGRPAPRAHPLLGLRGHVGRLIDLRYKSVLRGTVVVLLSTIAAFRLSHFPNNYATAWLLLPLLCAVAGTVDTMRCMQKRWNWYHGGVVLCLYTDLMAISMIVFFLLYPLWL